MVGYFENLFRALRRRVSRSELVIALFGLPVSKGTANQPGLVLIQIDGLSRHQMERAVSRGRMPFLRRLLARENYEKRTFYPGLPASTPAVQAELFYGERGAVPAFSFLNREAKRVYSMFDSECAKEVEAEISAKREGLLRGGSSWSNIYTGGASTDDSHFCASRLGLGDTFRSRRVLQCVTFPFLHFSSLVRLLTLFFAELGVGIRDLFHGVFKGESLLMECRTLISRVFVCIGLREILTIGVKIDVARGLPVVHANFLGYDEQSHRRGPSSAFAHWSLKGIDRAIKQIYRAAQRSARRDYQVWIYSDHGQEETRLFANDGKHLEEIIQDELEGFESKTPAVKPKAPRPHRCIYLSRKSGDRIVEGYKSDPAGGDEEWFSVAAMGPVGHLYLIHPRARAQKLKLAERLARKGRVPGVLVRNESGNFEWLHDHKRLRLPEEAPEFLPHPEAMKGELAQDLVGLCEQKCAGDIILLGWQPDKPATSFVDEHGSHAGPGPEETQGFVLLPPSTKLPNQSKEFLRPVELRAAALHFLRRQLIPSRASKKPARTCHVRVMTYNVHGCRGMDGRMSVARIARIIERYEPDIVAVQELDFGRVRSQLHDQPHLLAAELEMRVQFCPTVVDHNEQYGHALLCHSPMNVVRTAVFNGSTRRRHIEPRGALWASVPINGLPVNLMNTHFGLRRKERMAQAGELLGGNWIGKIPDDEPLILCGDFNMIPRSRPYRAIAGRLRDVQQFESQFRQLNTYSTFHPFARIDHIFVSQHFVVEKIRVPRNDFTRVASDHLPLIADLNFRQP
jgi:endonuclease/exonuclease/phosphatase family metal-dependent hydrolase